MIDDNLKSLKKALQELLQLKKDLKKIAESRNSISKYRAIVQFRLERTGIDAEGTKLQTDSSIRHGTMAYSPMYEEIRLDKNRQINHVDLRWEGKYWNTKEIIVMSDYTLFYDGDIIKEGGALISDNFQTLYSNEDDFIQETAGLNDKEATEWINEAIMPEVQKRIDDIILRFQVY